MTAVIDNDIVIKVCCYGLVDELLLPVCENLDLAGVLGTVRYVAADRIQRMELTGGPDEAAARLAYFLDRVSLIEPTAEEQLLAADLEFAAQRASLNLDVGESHLCAMTVLRALPRLVTGDKRAITAMESLLDCDSRLLTLQGRLYCLEHLVLAALGRDSNEEVRARICHQTSVDKTLTICAGCRSETTTQVMAECLESYLRDLRKSAGRILAA